MFSLNKKNKFNLESPLGTIIGNNTTFKGSINSEEMIRIDGTFEGDITTSSDLIVGPTGIVNAQINAKNAIISGTITGNADIEEKIHIMPNAKFYGDIKSTNLIIEEGAIFKGSNTVKDNSQPDSE